MPVRSSATSPRSFSGARIKWPAAPMPKAFRRTPTTGGSSFRLASRSRFSQRHGSPFRVGLIQRLTPVLIDKMELSIVMAESDIKNEAEQQRIEMSDPVLLMLGIGKQLWKSEPGDSFVERLRSEDAPPPLEGRLDAPAQNIAESVWR